MDAFNSSFFLPLYTNLFVRSLGTIPSLPIPFIFLFLSFFQLSEKILVFVHLSTFFHFRPPERQKCTRKSSFYFLLITWTPSEFLHTISKWSLSDKKYSHICQSSSSICRAAGTDFPDPLSPLLLSFIRLWQVFRTTSRILT